jgi:hypothetical protein
LAIAEVLEITMGAAALLAGHPAEAAVDGLPLEAVTGCLDFGDDGASCELCGAGAQMESFDSFENGVSAAWRGSASLACSGETLMAGPRIVSWRFVLCKPRSR